MEIIREFKTLASRQIVLDIPEKFVETDLEILIIPLNEKTKKKQLTNVLFLKNYEVFGKTGTI